MIEQTRASATQTQQFSSSQIMGHAMPPQSSQGQNARDEDVDGNDRCAGMDHHEIRLSI